MDEFKAVVSANIRALREKNGYSISEIAKIIGINKNFLGNIERGDRSANYENLYKISRFYNVDIDSLTKLNFDNIGVAERENVDKEKKEREALKARIKFLSENELEAVKEIIEVLKKHDLF